MPTNIQGPAVYLAQFAGGAAPFNSLDAICAWAASCGFKGIQLPAWDSRLFDLDRAAESKTYCDEVAGTAGRHGITITELGSHLQGQLVAVHPAYDEAFDGFAPEAMRGNPKARQAWAVQQMLNVARASRHLGLSSTVSFPGALAWPFLYPWPQRPAGLIDEAFAELARRWKPILDVFDAQGVDVSFEIHPGEDVFDGITFEMFLAKLDDHPRCCINYDPSHFLLQQLDYLEFIDIYHQRIKALHIKDAEFRPNGRQGVYSGYQPWINRAGRFRSLGDPADTAIPRKPLIESWANVVTTPLLLSTENSVAGSAKSRAAARATWPEPVIATASTSVRKATLLRMWFFIY